MVMAILNILTGFGSSSDSNKDESLNCISTDNLLVPLDNDSNAWYLKGKITVADDALNVFQECASHACSQITFKVKSIKILIKSGGVTTHPLVRFSMSVDGKFVNNKVVNVSSVVTADYFNIVYMAWEPLIEAVDGIPFQFKITCDLDKTTRVHLETLTNLELLISKSCVHVLFDINEAFSGIWKSNKLAAMNEENRIVIKNFLGVDINLNVKNSKLALVNHPLVENVLIKGDRGYSFVAKDMSRVELFLNFFFNASCVLDRKIVCTNSSVR